MNTYEQVYLAIIGCVTMKLVETLTQMLSNKVNDVDYKNEARKHPKDFTRNKKMTFEELIFFILFSLKCSTQSALRRFFASIAKPVFMKQQSLSEARKK